MVLRISIPECHPRPVESDAPGLTPDICNELKAPQMISTEIDCAQIKVGTQARESEPEETGL